jgi:calcium/calmodulin-dependent protein kinase I
MLKSSLTDEDKAALAVEVKAMQMLNGHPNFVTLYDFFDEETHFYLVLELITGGELFDRICEKERYTEREARACIVQLAAAIQFAHARGVVHRDLKPENILLKSRNNDTSIKLADLGFAKVLSSPTDTMTTPCGTPGYVAPEVLMGRAYTASCDIWSLGVIFYILLCGCVVASCGALQCGAAWCGAACCLLCAM